LEIGEKTGIYQQQSFSANCARAVETLKRLGKSSGLQ